MRTWTFPEVRPKSDGPWTDEPDKAQWVDESTGLDCLVLRNRLGALCGYVGLPPGHPWHGKDYGAEELWDIDVHGGLTFADSCQEGVEDGYGICHVPEPGRPAEVWWLGFDTAHAGDLAPGMRDALADAAMAARYGRTDVYRDFDYVKQEIETLAEQCARATYQRRWWHRLLNRWPSDGARACKAHAPLIAGKREKDGVRSQPGEAVYVAENPPKE